MSNTSFWKQMFVGVTLLMFSTGIVLAEIGPTKASFGVDGTQQDRQITVVVVDDMGEVIGANVMVKGTTNGNITNMEGQAVLSNVPGDATLVVSYIGYVTQEVPVNNRNIIQVRLVEDTQNLDEVVVVGYGTQAKKDITGSVSVVSAEALQEQPVATFAEALQGKASGVYISSSGAPGSETTIRIRDVGSMNGSDPLIVVDGVSNVNIESVNPNDIESLQVLKDASATAIYGAQGANGVIIITTKQGSKQKVRISYDGYVGMAKMANSGFDLLDAWEHMDFQAQGMVNMRDIKKLTPGAHEQFGSLDANDQLTMPYATKPAGLSEAQVIAQFGSIAAWEASYLPNGSNSWARSAYAQMKLDGYSEAEARRGTNWYDEITRTGFVQEHQVSALGGGDKGSYAFSVGYHSREGTIKASYFDRYSLRANTSFIPNKYFSIGQNTNLSVTEMGGNRGTQGDDTPFAQTYTTQPWVPVYNIGGDYAGSQSPQGGRANSPVRTVATQENNWTRNFRGQTALWAEIKPIEGLNIRSQLSGTLTGYWQQAFSPITIMGNKEGDSQNNLREWANYRFSWQWTNTATYTRTFNEDHTITALIGTEALSFGQGRSMNARRYNYVFDDDPNTWVLNNGGSDNQENEGSMGDHITMFGMFFRGDYSYKGKYLATVSIRRDGASNFSESNRWGTFPSFNLGWRISDEFFMEQSREWLDDLKIRAGYGTTGNSNIGAYNHATRFATGNAYLYSLTGSDSNVYQGYAVRSLGNKETKWETAKMLNIGIDATAFNNRLAFGFDWYTKKTSDMLVRANWSALAGITGTNLPNINIGDMTNKGVDFSIGWRDRVGKVRYNATLNLSHYKNEVTKLGSSDLFESTRLNNVTITTVGQPIGMFYGYKVKGIYKSEDDVKNYTSNGKTVTPYGAVEGAYNPTAWVGRYIIEDVNGDGQIDSNDRTIIGNPHPDLTGGLNLGLSWNNFDLSTYLYFSVGNDIYKHYMFYTHYGSLQSNYDRDRRDNSWHPTDNPNGKYPLWATIGQEGGEAANESNSMYVQDGSYLRMQTLTLGYSLPKKHPGKSRT